jgi:hypothetical protein
MGEVMTVLEDVVSILNGFVLPSTTTLVTGTNLFYETSPDDLTDHDEIVMLAEESGESDYALGNNGVVIEKPRLHVLCRVASDSGILACRHNIEAVRRTLSVFGSSIVNGTTYLAIMEEGTPEYQGPDSSNRPIFTQEFVVWKGLEVSV